MTDFPETDKGLMSLCIEFAQLPHQFHKTRTKAHVRPYMKYDLHEPIFPKLSLMDKFLKGL